MASLPDVEKISKISLFVLAELRNVADRQTPGDSIYRAYAYASRGKKEKDLLENIQRRFTRMLPELRNLQYSERLNKLGLWTLEERRNRADLIEVLKILNGYSVVPVPVGVWTEEQKLRRKIESSWFNHIGDTAIAG